VRDSCGNTTDTFLCLKTIPIEDLFIAIFNTWINSGFINPALAYVSHSQVTSQTDVLTFSSYSPVVDGHFLQDYPSNLMAARKFVSLPMMLGTTTDEFTEIIPTNFNISSDAQILSLFKENFVSVSAPTLEYLMSLFPLSQFPNEGPPGSGIEWSRVVDILNNLLMFCESYFQAIDVSSLAPVWKCELRTRTAVHMKFYLNPWTNSCLCRSMELSCPSSL